MVAKADIDEKALVRMYKKGMSLSQIVPIAGAGYTAVRARLLKLGVKLRPRGGDQRSLKAIAAARNKTGVV